MSVELSFIISDTFNSGLPMAFKICAVLVLQQIQETA